eukprot:CAMPEP_0170613428 /NCGR_PEP_ID=MMETSP0224-20130122/24270_1 /TAXON_ID=285029 /ORGANISM="Togula jolla, Strain CCCM 725" /LENGTH=203 /DNA_ID=CAMNT_0010939035 /DNA_START=36 /DNA_END=644 /DNA_ORIENTATION=+
MAGASSDDAADRLPDAGGAPAVDRAKIEEAVCTVLSTTCLETTSLREVRALTEKHLEMQPGHLDEHKDLVKEIATEEIRRIQSANASLEESTPSKATGGSRKRASPADAKSKKKEKAEPSDKKQKTGAATIRQSGMMTKKEFMDKATTMTVCMGDKKMLAAPKIFSTGSCSFYATQKLTFKVGDKEVSCQCQVQCVVIGSKEW